MSSSARPAWRLGQTGCVLDSLAPARRRLVLVVLGWWPGRGGRRCGDRRAPARWVERPGATRSGRTPNRRSSWCPGYGGGTAGLEVMARALRREGRDVTVVRLAGDGTGDLKRAGRACSSEPVRRTGSPSVDVVGYSAGGVTVRLWVRGTTGGRWRAAS